MRSSVFLAILMPLLIASGPAPAADECLSRDEIAQATRMATIMAVGSEIRRCGQCLGEDRYPGTVHAYEDGLLSDFFAAKDTFNGQEKIDYADELVRMAARKASNAFSGECDACSSLAGKVATLITPERRAQFYAGEIDTFSRDTSVRTCP
jgi:hypothetical protein